MLFREILRHVLKFHTTGIFLSGFKLSVKEIDEKLSVFREEDGALPMDHVIALKRYCKGTDTKQHSYYYGT